VKARTASSHNQALGGGHVEPARGDAPDPSAPVAKRGPLVELEGWIDNALRENGIREDGNVDFIAGRSQALAEVKREIRRIARGGR